MSSPRINNTETFLQCSQRNETQTLLQVPSHEMQAPLTGQQIFGSPAHCPTRGPFKQPSYAVLLFSLLQLPLCIFQREKLPTSPTFSDEPMYVILTLYFYLLHIIYFFLEYQFLVISHSYHNYFHAYSYIVHLS